MLLHVVLLALSASTKAPLLRVMLYVFNLVHAFDVGARILAEGVHDFWSFKRLRKLHEAGENPCVPLVPCIACCDMQQGWVNWLHTNARR